MLHALGDGRRIHHAQVLLADRMIAQLAIEHGVRILFRIVAVNAVDARGLQQDVGLEFQARWAAAVSVVTNGLPVPAARITIRPFSKCRRARRRM